MDKKFIDAWIILDKNRRITTIQYLSLFVAQKCKSHWSDCIGKILPQMSDFQFNQQQKTMLWHDISFNYVEISIEKNHCILLQKEVINTSIEMTLYQKALDVMLEGIQIYDHNAKLVHINQASRDISHIPNHVDVKGKHVLDLYDVDNNFSTVMTCLRTQAPVINRLDSFKVSNGANVVSVNTAYPIFDKKQLIGTVEFDLNLPSINQQINRLESIKRTMDTALSNQYLPKYNGYSFIDIIGHNQKIMNAVALAKKIAPQECNVLIVGETGTGKEIFAQSIHKASRRRKNKFFAINCAAIPEALVESTFFGTSKGAFTGSINKVGILEEINGGTLFLDELNSMSLSMQSKLLRVIQEGIVHKVGDTKDIAVDIRFISSCNENATKIIENNIIRSDLYYRLSTITIEIPALRCRKDDIKELVEFYLQKNVQQYVKSIKAISSSVLVRFQQYNWPGNIRELFNALDYILNTIEEDQTQVEIKHLPNYLQPLKNEIDNEQTLSQLNRDVINSQGAQNSLTNSIENLILQQMKLPEILQIVERKILEKTLKQCYYNINSSAQTLGISRQRLQYRMERLKMDSQLIWSRKNHPTAAEDSTNKGSVALTN